MDEIKSKKYDFYLSLKQFANSNKIITSQFCKEVLRKYQVQLEQEKQLAILEAQNKVMVADIKAKIG